MQSPSNLICPLTFSNVFIVQKILLDENGLTYIRHTYERFFAFGTVLSNTVKIQAVEM